MHKPADHPHVLVFPPLLFGATFAAGLLLHWIDPLVSLDPLYARLLGALLTAAGGWLAFSAEEVMRRAGTNVRPDRPTLSIVTDGPFRFTRNPLYLAATALYAGVALLCVSVWPLLLLAPLLAILHWGVVRREERYLEAKFGDAYLAYKARVRRWL
ncbi:MAG: methyltransferase family protein [Gammaproteobacteria bacterium]